MAYFASPSLIQRIIQAESGGNPNAVSPKGAIGLMQIMPATARDPGFGVNPIDPALLKDPAINEEFGTDYFNAMLTRYEGDDVAARVAYNAGPGVADRFVSSGHDLSVIPPETREYLKRTSGDMSPQSLALERASFMNQPPGDRGAGQIPQGALGLGSAAPPQPVAPLPQVQAPAPSRSLIPTFQDDPIGAIGLVLQEFTGALQGQPSRLMQLQQMELQRRRGELEEYKAGREVLMDALEMAKGGNLEAGFALLDGSPLDDGTKGQFRNFLQHTVDLGEARVTQIAGLAADPASTAIISNACGANAECALNFLMEPKLLGVLEAASDRAQMPILEGLMEDIATKAGGDLQEIAKDGVTYTELSQILTQARQSGQIDRAQEAAFLRNAPALLGKHGLTYVPQETEFKRSEEIAKEGRAEARTIATERRAQARQLEKEARDIEMEIEKEDRAEARSIAKEGRSAVSELDKEKRAEARQIAAERREEARKLDEEARKLEEKLAEEERSEARLLGKEGREAKEFRSRKTFEEGLKKPASDLVDESGNLKNEVSNSIYRQAVAAVGGNINSFGEPIGLTPDTAQQATAISAAAEAEILAGRAVSVGQAVKQAQAAMPEKRGKTEAAPKEEPIPFVPEGVDPAQGTGASSVFGAPIGEILSFLGQGQPYPQVSKAKKMFRQLEDATSAALSQGVKPIPAQKLIDQYKANFAVDPSAIVGDEEALSLLQQTRTFLTQQLADRKKVADNPRDYTKDDVSNARQSVVAIERMVGIYDEIIGKFGKEPAAKGSAPAGMPRLRLNPATGKLEPVQ